MQGCIFFESFEKYELLVGWGKNMMIHNEKRGWKGKFSLYFGEKYHFGKQEGGGAKILYFREIYTPGAVNLCGKKRRMLFVVIK